MTNLWETTVAIGGRFKSLSKAELEIILRGHGVARVVDKPSRAATHLFCDDESGKLAVQARDLGLEIVAERRLRSALGPPLGGYPARLQRRFDSWCSTRRWIKAKSLVLGAGCDERTLKRVEERIGFALPDEARSLFTEVDGISLFWASKDGPELRKAPIEWSRACHQDGAFWRELAVPPGSRAAPPTFGLAVVPPVETLFFTPWDTRLFVKPKVVGTLKIGTMKVTTDELYDNLFLLDAFHPFFQAGLYADKKQERLWVVLAQDYAADWESSHPVPFEIYFEGLIAELGMYRYFTPTSKAAWPRAFHTAKAINKCGPVLQSIA